MEERADEKILEYVNEMEDKELRKDITNGKVKINDCFYEFEESEFFDGEFKMYIPNTFFDMPMEARKLKYPFENRPEIIKCNNNGSIAITLKQINNNLSNDGVKKLKEAALMLNRRVNSGYTFLDEGMLEVDYHNIGYYDFMSIAIDDYIYNFTFLMEFKKQTLMGTFSCGYSEHKQWKDDIIFQIIKTIKVKKSDTSEIK